MNDCGCATHNPPITEIPGVSGGEPCVRGTRLSMRFLQGLVEKLGWSWTRIAREYPHVPEGLLYEALTLWFHATNWREARRRA